MGFTEPKFKVKNILTVRIVQQQKIHVIQIYK